MSKNTFRGIRVFVLVWIGQLVSVVGSGLTAFALGIWVYQQTGSVTQLAFIYICAVLPNILISPVAGALVDRWDRRLVMILSDVAAGVSTLAVALLFLSGQLVVWHICLASTILSIGKAFQEPAYKSSVPLLVSQQHLGRANGMVQLAQAATQVLSPFLGGVLLVNLGLQGVLLIDVATFAFAVTTLLIVRLPSPPPPAAEEDRKPGSLWREMLVGWRYLVGRRGLFDLLFFFAVINLLLSAAEILRTPLVLSIASPTVLGSVMSVGGLGMLIGGAAISVWGGPKRRVYGVLGFVLLIGVSLVMTGIRPSVPLFFVATFLFFLGIPIIGALFHTLFQSKVASEMLGRAYALFGVISGTSVPLGHFLAGPLADRVFEPLLLPGGPLADSVGRITGVGPGRGTGFLIVIAGILMSVVALLGLLYRPVRLVDTELPDAGLGPG